MNTLNAAQRFQTHESSNSFLKVILKPEAASAAESRFRNWTKAIRAFGFGFANFVLSIAKTSIVRSVAPGARALERHEFESIQARRGGFGNVF